MKKSTGVLVVAFAVIPALADISGHTDLENPGIPVGFNPWTATNNWAVLSPGSVLASALTAGGFTAGTGSGAWTVPTGSYIYLYQESNATTSGTALHEFTNSLGLPNNSSPTSPSVWGQFEGLVMQNASGNVGPLNELNTITGIGKVAGLNAADIVLGTASFVAKWTPPGGLTPGETGSLFVFVSPYAPGTFVGSLQNGGAGIGGPSPAPTIIPEPGAVVLGLIGLVPLAFRKKPVAK